MICFKCGAEMPENAYFCGVCSIQLREKFSDIVRKSTPHGGVMSEFFYFDEEHKPCAKEKACFMEICEYDAEGKEIYKFTAHKKKKGE